jgi:hypothetical protein
MPYRMSAQQGMLIKVALNNPTDALFIKISSRDVHVMSGSKTGCGLLR